MVIIYNRHSTTVLNIGSASQLAVINRKTSSSSLSLPNLPPSVMEVPYFNSETILVAASLSGGNVVSTFVKMLNSWFHSLQESQLTDNPNSVSNAVTNEADIYRALITTAEGKMDTTLEMDVRLWGERHSPGVTGSVSNISPHNLELGDVGSALCRGIVKNLVSMMTEEIIGHLKVGNMRIFIFLCAG